MKILFLAPTLEVGGAERQIVLTANGLSALGHSVCIALFRATGPLLDDLSPDVTVHDLKKNSRWDLLLFMGRAIQLVRKSRPDVIYSFMGVPNLTALLLKAACSSIRVVWAVRASDMDLSKYGWLAKVCYFLECSLSRFADSIVANSEAGKMHSLAQGFSSKSFSVVPNGIDTSFFKPDAGNSVQLRQQWGAKKSDILIGIVARLDPIKDHLSFLRAAKIVLQKESYFRFVCVGEGGLGNELKELSIELGLSDTLVWFGSYSDMPAVYNAMDILCLSSVSEGFPNVLGEAMSCGVPCVTTDVGDASLVVGETGLVVSKSDPEALAEAIVSMASRVRSGDILDTRKRVVELFSLERMVLATEDILSGKL